MKVAIANTDYQLLQCSCVAAHAACTVHRAIRQERGHRPGVRHQRNGIDDDDVGIAVVRDHRLHSGEALHCLADCAGAAKHDAELWLEDGVLV